MSLLERMTCPHCWAVFDTHAVLWISSHHSLYGDTRLENEQKRFLPTRFTADGFALDEMASPCHRIACPACHLEIPRVATEMEAWIVSVIGSPTSGKSFYLGALARTLSRILPTRFRVSFTDSDANLNKMINSYVQSMFGNKDAESLLPLGNIIARTESAGAWYSTVKYNTSEVLYPRPYMFTLRPEPTHPHLTDPGSAARQLCLYDNSGESFLAGKDENKKPVTRHLAHASLLLFLFDPVQDHDFRREYAKLGKEWLEDDRIVLNPQQVVLTEAANRFRLYKNLPGGTKHDKPLFVVVTKQDLWGHLVPSVSNDKPLLLNGPTGIAYVNVDKIKEMSEGIEKMLMRLCPAIVDAANSFAKTVIYVGVSSLGTKPVKNNSGQWAIKPCDISPIGVESPILYGLNQLLPGLFPSGRKIPAWMREGA